LGALWPGGHYTVPPTSLHMTRAPYARGCDRVRYLYQRASRAVASSVRSMSAIRGAIWRGMGGSADGDAHWGGGGGRETTAGRTGSLLCELVVTAEAVALEGDFAEARMPARGRGGPADAKAGAANGKSGG
jgi:hypothetical protein